MNSPKWLFLVVNHKQLEKHIIHLIHELLERLRWFHITWRCEITYH